MTARQCNHEFTRLLFASGDECQGFGPVCETIGWGLGTVLSARCDDCDEQLSLGESNDGPVLTEIHAAELGQSPDVWRRWMDLDPGVEHDVERIGIRPTAGIGALSPTAGHAAIMHGWTPGELADYWAGWLALQIATHDEQQGDHADEVDPMTCPIIPGDFNGPHD